MIQRLKELSEKYETKEFIMGDPSWFMHQVEDNTDKEIIAFIASALSYGSRKQFMAKIQMILDDIMKEEKSYHAILTPKTEKSRSAIWLGEGKYKRLFPDNENSFYRLYSFHTFRIFLDALAEIINKYGSIKQLIISENNISIGEKIDAIAAIKTITKWFLENGSSGIIPKDTTSSCKRICMFLRWMVRDNSPVDIGIWKDVINKQSLIIPMDTHVVQEALKLGLLTSRSTSMANAIKLTRKLKEAFPEDPTKGDFALFGLGVDTNEA